ncbi:phosphatidylinositol-4-phosphate 5-kinase family protein [Heterostelium album PN500]|uniref:Phosphatidylinositol-4-phosphate 5-kinase family protein n=1 Tax=Heterostelium pallidum (strain ATCC 26659 / Pp 5 / PN500) TaxID=670386 RepID=D3AX26_HETP5|nr:phosphatidylinositol-4-phosphate 5-kinase family protein [Heterostelium album PN500]EFA86849.1 phosphatidylinositol-4-phosphate 5-kinase family protein [Heterostelium album PN500]|eukprot:XP_020438952.1 phosphatidylinositol-4-phosphate 5-kinase family protein [Heterostelium album PN500]
MIGDRYLVSRSSLFKMLMKDGGQQQQLQQQQQQVLDEKDINKSDDYSTSDEEEENDQQRDQRIRRTDSIVAYKSKNGTFLNIRSSVDEQNNKNIADDSSESSSENQDFEYSGTEPVSVSVSSSTTTTTTSSSSTAACSSSQITNGNHCINISTNNNNNNNNVLSVSTNPIPSNLTNRRDSVDSNDPNFGYEDQPIYKTISDPIPTDLKPINSPIPNRPVFKVELSPENELINQSLIALRTSLLNSNSEDKQPITQDQFELIKKYRISIEKRSLIKDFAPNVFKDLRSRLNIDQTKFLKSWSSYISNEAQTKQNSNSFTIYSSDRKYILKTISKAESIKLRKLLPHYYDYLTYNSNSMLLKYLGLFRVDKRMNQNFYVVLLLNVFNTCCNVDQTISTKQSSESLKIKSHKKIQLDPTLKSAIYKQIEKDTTFLSTHDLADFNLIIGINKIDSKHEQESIVAAGESDTPTTTELSSSIQSHPPLQQHDGLSSSASSTPTSSVFTPQLITSSLELNSSVDTSAPVIIEPIKTVPRLLFFVEEVECITKSNNFTINKSLKKSFSTLPRSWTSETVEDPIGNISGPYRTDKNTQPTINSMTQSFILQTDSSEMSSSLPPSLFNSLPSVLPLSHRASLQLSQQKQQQPNNNNSNNNNNNNVNSMNGSSKLSSLSLTSNSSGGSGGSGFLTPQQQQNQRRCINGFISENNNEIYYFCILDLLASVESTKQKVPIKLMSKVRHSSPNSPNTFLKKFLNNAKNLLFLDNSVQTINSNYSNSTGITVNNNNINNKFGTLRK